MHIMSFCKSRDTQTENLVGKISVIKFENEHTKTVDDGINVLTQDWR